MKWNRTLLVLALLLALPALASAGFLFGKKPAKPEPAVHVPELIAAVKNDGDENKRAAAAEELRQYDPAAFPEMVPALIDVLLHDAKPAVRAEAAQTLGKLRPINQQAGLALEQALAKDASMRVRLQARSSLLMYHMAGYHGGKPAEPPAAPTKEPPLADPKAPLPPAVKTTTVPHATPVPTQTEEPPLAPPLPGDAKPKPPLVPTEPPVLQKPPAAPSEGPALNPPE